MAPCFSSFQRPADSDLARAGGYIVVMYVPNRDLGYRGGEHTAARIQECRMHVVRRLSHGHFWKIDFSQGLAMASPDAADGAERAFYLDSTAVKQVIELLFRNRLSAARLYGSDIELDV